MNIIVKGKDEEHCSYAMIEWLAKYYNIKLKVFASAIGALRKDNRDLKGFKNEKRK